MQGIALVFILVITIFGCQGMPNIGMNLKQKKTDEYQGFNFSIYNRYHQIIEYLNHIGATNELVNISILGKTAENRTIMSVKLSRDNCETRKAIFIECGSHAREWISPAACLSFINMMLAKDESDPNVTSLIDKYDWYVIPLANPDGYAYTWTKWNRDWRKNRGQIFSKYCRGVDLNRNYDIFFWDGNHNLCGDDYRGRSAFSEPETRAIKTLAESLNGEIKAFFSIHNYGQAILYPYGYSNASIPNKDKLIEIGKFISNEIKKTHGKEFEVKNVHDWEWPVFGTAIDWFYDVMNVNITFILELRDDGKNGFLLPETEIIPSAEEVFMGITKAMLQY